MAREAHARGISHDREKGGGRGIARSARPCSASPEIRAAGAHIVGEGANRACAAAGGLSGIKEGRPPEGGHPAGEGQSAPNEPRRPSV